mgnify:CR=1 FL=1
MDSFEWLVPDGTYLLPEVSTRRRLRYSWWSRQDYVSHNAVGSENDANTESSGMMSSLEVLVDLEREHGRPLDFILGHSQGAAVAVLIGLLHAGMEDDRKIGMKLPSLPSTFILMGGFLPQDSSLDECYGRVPNGGIDIPSHWLIGEKDSTVKPAFS